MPDLLTHEEYQAIGKSLDFPTNAFIYGQFQASKSGNTFETINPATGQVIAKIAACNADDVDHAVMKARESFDQGHWSKLHPSERKEALIKLSKLIKRNIQELAVMESIDSGKPIRDCVTIDLPETIDCLLWHAEAVDKIYDQTAPAGEDALAVIVREPIGVVVAIVPWNAQLFLSATKIAPALAAGNTVVVKASEQAPAALFKLAELVDKAGFPAGVINILTGFGEPCGRIITSHPKVARVAFTGGSEVAKHIVRNTAENFAHVSLELGGKSPMLIFDDCDIEGAVNGIIAGNFGASGQSCVAGSRVFIQKSIHSKVLRKIKERAKAIIVGDPLDKKTQVGPLATTHQVERAHQCNY